MPEDFTGIGVFKTTFRLRFGIESVLVYIPLVAVIVVRVIFRLLGILLPRFVGGIDFWRAL